MIYLTLILAFFTGWYLRELLSTLQRLEARIGILRAPEKQKTQTSFAEPMTRAEVIGLMEQERIDAINDR